MSIAQTIMPKTGDPAPDSAKDPLRLMIEIAKDSDISDEDKTALILYSNSRFKNRRRMAYISLLTLVASFVFIFVAAIIDGTGGQTTNILEKIKEHQMIINWIGGFLTSIVAMYFGVSSWRPAS